MYCEKTDDGFGYIYLLYIKQLKYTKNGIEIN